MTRYLLLGALVFVAAAGWSIGEKLSADALGMVLGILFGVLASVPAALLVLVAARRSARQDDDRPNAAAHRERQALPQPPVVVVTAPPVAGYGYGGPMPGQAPSQNDRLPPSHQIIDAHAERQFRVVGEEDELLDDFSL